jgi:hypothetical protein
MAKRNSLTLDEAMMSEDKFDVDKFMAIIKAEALEIEPRTAKITWSWVESLIRMESLVL